LFSIFGLQTEKNESPEIGNSMTRDERERRIDNHVQKEKEKINLARLAQRAFFHRGETLNWLPQCTDACN
jgi:hypothetical protein